MLEDESPSKAFLGVRFVLFGFDRADEGKIRSKLIDGGGVEDAQYCRSSTHVIVDKIVLEDPICVAAQNDGKTLVTGLWVEHSYDIGMPVDASSVMYRPLRDLKGIPSANNLILCLTGYQRQDRDDIMTMVGLMGAQFSKPLVANRVTHLICYKFEGEKYELAKKIKKIKLVNHRWLEDCLRDWELLPEDDYSKSGYELEAMEAEAKDSEEEAEETKPRQSRVKSIERSPHNSKIGTVPAGEISKMTMEVSNATKPADSSNSKANDVLLPPINVKGSYLVSSFDSVIVPPDGLNNDVASVELPVQNEKRPLPAVDEGNVFLDAKLSAKSYSRKMQGQSPSKSKMPILSGETSVHVSGSPEGTTAWGSSVAVPPKIQLSKDLLGFGFIESDQKEAPSVGSSCKAKGLHHEEESAGLLPQKRMIDSVSDSKSQKMSRNSKAGVMGSSVLGYGNHAVKNDLSLFMTETVRMEPNEDTTEKSPLTYSKRLESKPCKLDPRNSLLKNDLASTITNTPKAVQNKANEQRSPQTCFKALKESTPGSKSIFGSSGTVEAASAGKAGEMQGKLQNLDVSSTGGKSPVETSHSPPNRELLDGGSNRLAEKPLSRKTLGTRSKLSSNAKKKDSICFNNFTSPDNNAVGLSGKSEKESSVNAICSSEDGKRLTHGSFSMLELDISPQTVSKIGEKEAVGEQVNISGDDGGVKTGFMDDETESANEKPEDDYLKIDEEKPELPELTHEAGNVEVDPVNGGSHGNEHMNVITPGNAGNTSESKEATSSSKGNSMKGLGGKRKKQVSRKTKTVIAPVASKRGCDMRASQNRKKSEEEGNEKENFDPDIENNDNNSSDSKLGSFMKVEKRPVDIDQGLCISKTVSGTTELKPNTKPLKSTKNSKKANSNLAPAKGVASRVDTEPSRFIVSGHRLQRKEFHKVIRDLKGRFCRDSHQWSYQATHFIVPDPIRRTEKFFAAAASGRWILKTDYLSACSKVGKFLPEEPYEWHNNGLSEDGAINLEAPRKWRLLREKTGHGALYGMCIIIYGECIVPPLDTLKRVVKAGDGTILATSPPYTRFLKSGVDFAVVSPGISRADLWVQEFLKHEIPCVVADYLVEYVCKPGYPLERHVQYNTHEWAEKSLANLTRRAEEVAEDTTPSGDCGTDSDDISCQVCGSRDREEVMLICGDESGSTGCGIGVHIDCCDPPLPGVPSGDWLCSDCSKSSKSPTPAKKRKKGLSSTKNK